MKRYLLILFALYLSNAYSQIAIEDSLIAPKLILEKERAYGFIAHNRGLGLSYSFGKRKNAFKSNYWSFELLNYRSLEQTRLLNPFIRNSKSYFLGKKNYVYDLRIGKKYYKQINSKPYWNGVELDLVYAFGIDIFILRPYHVEVFKIDEKGNLTTEIEPYNSEYHNEYNIKGRGPLFYGFDKSTVQPGIYSKLGVSFDFSKKEDKINALEAGIAVDIIPLGIDFTAFKSKEYYMLTFYLSYSFGKKYNDYYIKNKKKKKTITPPVFK
ncbi:MAG: hypothetical protein ACEPOV_03615 [Hyphomicrobiales bacterium]